MSTPANDATAGAPAGFLSKKSTYRLVYYNVLLMLLLGAGLYFVVSAAATVQAGHEAEARKEKLAAKRSAESIAALNISRSPCGPPRIPCPANPWQRLIPAPVRKANKSPN